MDAVILAAGLGTRLRPHTLTTPKPLLPIRGRPILDWTLGALPSAVDRVLVVVNYLAEQVEVYLRSQTHFSEWVTVRQEVPRGTGDALLACRSQLRPGKFLVLNGDDLFGAADLERLAACEAGILVYPVDDPQKFGIVFRRPDGTLDRLLEKVPLEGRQLANTGAYVFPETVFEIELKPSKRGEYEITDYVSGLAARGPVQVVEAGYWKPIGTVEALEEAQKEDVQKFLAGRERGSR